MGKSPVFFLFFLSAFALYAGEPASLPALPDTAFPLINEIEWKDDSPRGLALLPRIDGTDPVRRRFQELKPEICVERLYRVALPENREIKSREDREDLFVRVADIFGNPQTQTKYRYESFRQKKEVPLIEEAYICDSKGRRQAPLVFSRADIPGVFRYFQYIDEINFSAVVMDVSMEITGDYVYVRSENAESLRYGIIPLLPRESMYSDNFIFIMDHILYVYSITQLKNDVKIKKIGPYTIRPFGMFGSRMDVMAAWLKGELHTPAAPRQ